MYEINIECCSVLFFFRFLFVAIVVVVFIWPPYAQTGKYIKSPNHPYSTGAAAAACANLIAVIYHFKFIKYLHTYQHSFTRSLFVLYWKSFGTAKKTTSVSTYIHMRPRKNSHIENIVNVIGLLSSLNIMWCFLFGTFKIDKFSVEIVMKMSNSK